ncbi:GntP family permease [Oceanivirga salmonicida]|uniref:GntP family permease n=1 Tax=Oceanivirga salmonicida TaxID=1769291 RepID=UPI0012E1C73F|nr:SLC13 family permease [Oceanivirga salmonicida]
MINAYGAIAGLLLAIFLIIKKFNPAYSLILGSLIGGLLGGANLTETVDFMIMGAKDMIPAILRIITAGVLAGVLIETGSAAKIADTIIKTFGKDKAILAMIFSTFILTAVGVFIDISVITVAPIALAVAKKSNITKTAVLIAMIGGGKAGNIISPNPNAIAAAESFNLPLTSVMFAGIIPAIAGIIITIIIAKLLIKKGSSINDSDIEEITIELPNLFSSIIGPLVAIFLLALRPIAGIIVDPLIALPTGGVVACIATGKFKHISDYCKVGLSKMSGVAIILIGTGTVAGIIANSNIKVIMTAILDSTGAPAFLLAPLAGILMSAATSSTTSGTAVASQVFGPTIIQLGVEPIAGAAMIHSGATVLDHLPHGSFFHATGGAVNMNIRERLTLIPYESLVGLTMTIVSTIIFGIIGG